MFDHEAEQQRSRRIKGTDRLAPGGHALAVFEVSQNGLSLRACGPSRAFNPALSLAWRLYPRNTILALRTSAAASPAVMKSLILPMQTLTYTKVGKIMTPFGDAVQE